MKMVKIRTPEPMVTLDAVGKRVWTPEEDKFYFAIRDKEPDLAWTTICAKFAAAFDQTYNVDTLWHHFQQSHLTGNPWHHLTPEERVAKQSQRAQEDKLLFMLKEKYPDLTWREITDQINLKLGTSLRDGTVLTRHTRGAAQRATIRDSPDRKRLASGI